MASIVIFGTGDIARLAHFYFTTDSEHTVVAFTVDRAHAAPSAALGASADAQCKKAKDGQMIDFAKLAGPKRRHTLQFRGEATGLVPTDATKKLLDAWGVESPELWWNAVKSPP